MATFRVRPGCSLPHLGTIINEGAVVDLGLSLAVDPAIACLVDEVDALGNLVTPRGLSSIEAELASARPHERVSILEQALAKSKADVDLLTAAIAAESSSQTSALVVEPSRPRRAKNTDADPA